MTENQSEQEPSIEEILASIRQIISDDDEEVAADSEENASEEDEDSVADPIRHESNDVLELTEDDLVEDITPVIVDAGEDAGERERFLCNSICQPDGSKFFSIENFEFENFARELKVTAHDNFDFYRTPVVPRRRQRGVCETLFLSLPCLLHYSLDSLH